MKMEGNKQSLIKINHNRNVKNWPSTKKIMKEVRNILPQVGTRDELIKEVAKKTDYAKSTVDDVLGLMKFKTDFPQGFAIHKENIHNNKIFEETVYYKLWKLLNENGPMFTFEIVNKFKHKNISNFYKKLKMNGYPIYRTAISRRIAGAHKPANFSKKGRMTIYYLENQRELALKRLEEFNPNLNTQIKASFERAILDGSYKEVCNKTKLKGNFNGR